MSRRDELAAVLAEHRWRSDRRCTCGWRPDRTIPQFPDSPRASTIVQYEQHQAGAVLAWLGEQLGDEGLCAAVANTVPLGWTDRDPYRDVNEAAAVALGAVQEWFGVAE